MDYRLTPTYVERIQNTNSILDCYRADRLKISHVKKKDRSIDQQLNFVTLAIKIKALEKRLIKVATLEVPMWNLVKTLIEADETTWTDVEIVSWHKALANSEGRGETALRERLGIKDVVTSDACDLVKRDENGNIVLYEEVKNIQGRGAKGRFVLQAVQVGKTGRQAYCMWLLETAEKGMLVGLPEDVRQSLGTGEVSPGTLFKRLSGPVLDSLNEKMSPFSVLSGWDAINCTTRDGYLRIPKEDCNEAWQLTCITKSGPKYALRRDYILKRLLATRNEHVNVTPEQSLAS
jgi:hypothetical protein